MSRSIAANDRRESMVSIDLNCDMGESFGAYTIGADEAVMANITSANVACGYHGGDPGVMRRTVRLARQAGVAVGAHPGFPDLAGFGRREMQMAAEDVEDMVLYQIGALAAIARSEGVQLAHVKPHGALYNMAVADKAIAAAIARAAAAFDPGLIFFALPGSELARAAAGVGLQVALEGFADRAYEPDGRLTPRSRHGAVIHDVNDVVVRAVRLATEGKIIAANGSRLDMRVDTICTHGDTPGAQSLTRALRAGLEHAGVTVAAVASKRP
jgi:5-oxoprolinase (ATP-hydrolysing) subunit A